MGYGRRQQGLKPAHTDKPAGAQGVDMDDKRHVDSLVSTLLASCSDPKGACFDDIKGMMREQKFLQIQDFRYYVAITLHEAQSLRAALHMRQNVPLLADSPGTAVALRLVSPTGRSAGELIDASHGYAESLPASYQSNIAAQCYRFMDCG